MMTEFNQSEHLQPSLLDRLTDSEPNKQVESLSSRSLGMDQLRACVQRDLAWLLNSTSISPLVDFSEFDELPSSVVNFGVPEFSGVSASSLDIKDIEKGIKQSILNFEPRLMKGSVKVSSVSRDEMSENAISFDIEANFWAQPVPIRILLQSDLDLETGDFIVREKTGF
ncbi:type VI secretion system baseplate subunit TssE [Pelagibaculum spongiae]|uniref:Type VI secretion system baseplate subunit TssE n=1 Tax=Pelagibaculum spongiae TaxID=2080658 RepID=A0A2V1GYI3_9GAMM|nr:type VI secretion system baseplate subunit TssE [Pelagibaculum spongiae]